MKVKNSISNSFLFSLAFFLLLGALWELYTSERIGKMKQQVLEVNCDTINSDATRPDSRRCARPLSFENNIFRFKTISGRIEQYENIEIINQSGEVKTILIFRQYED